MIVVVESISNDLILKAVATRKILCMNIRY